MNPGVIGAGVMGLGIVRSLLRGGFVELNDPNGPYGAKGASETAILPGAPAIANAVYNAIGIRLRKLPLRPEEVLRALRERERAR